MISQQQHDELGDSVTSDDARLGQVDIRKYTFKLFLVILAVYSSYFGTEWLFTHHKNCRQGVFTDRGRKRERVHWYCRVVKSECKFLHGYLRENTERMLQMALKEKVLVGETNPQDYQKKEEKVRNRKEKALHGEFTRQTSGG